MPPNVALVLCIVFIASLFAMDIRRKPNVSSALWIPLIWAILSGSKALVLWLNPELAAETEFDTQAGNPIDRALLSTLIVIGILILWTRKPGWLQGAKSNPWILALFLYMGLSILWSDFPGVSLKRWIRVVGSLVMALVVLTERSPFEATKTLLRRCAYLLLPLSVLFIRYFRDIGVAYNWDGSKTMWVGATTHKNTLGVLAAVSAIYFLSNITATWRQRKKLPILLDIGFLLMSLWLLAGSSTSTSMTSRLVFVAGVCVLVASAKPDPRYMRACILLGVCAFLFLQLAADFLVHRSVFSFLVASSGHESTFFARTGLWQELLRISSRHPVLGAGYGGFWVDEVVQGLWDMFPDRPRTAHSGYLGVYVELGLVGLLLALMVLVTAYRNILKRLPIDFKYARFQMALLVMILLHNMTESSLTVSTSLLWFLLLLVAIDIGKPSLPTRGQATDAVPDGVGGAKNTRRRPM